MHLRTASAAEQRHECKRGGQHGAAAREGQVEARQAASSACCTPAHDRRPLHGLLRAGRVAACWRLRRAQLPEAHPCSARVSSTCTPWLHGSAAAHLYEVCAGGHSGLQACSAAGLHQLKRALVPDAHARLGILCHIDLRAGRQGLLARLHAAMQAPCHVIPPAGRQPALPGSASSHSALRSAWQEHGCKQGCTVGQTAALETADGARGLPRKTWPCRTSAQKARCTCAPRRLQAKQHPRERFNHTLTCM